MLLLLILLLLELLLLLVLLLLVLLLLPVLTTVFVFCAEDIKWLWGSDCWRRTSRRYLCILPWYVDITVSSVEFLLHFVWGVAEVKYIVVTAVCVSVSLSLAAVPHYCMDPVVTWGEWQGVLSSCALFGGFAVAHRFHSAEHESQSVPGSVLLGCIAALARCSLLLQME